MATKSSGRRPRRKHTAESMSRVRRLAVNAADHLIGKKRYEAAASILENFLNGNPEAPGHAEVLRLLGKVRLAQGQAQAAARLFERALQCFRDDLAADGQPAADDRKCEDVGEEALTVDD